jgi:YHS domain-containing protein
MNLIHTTMTATAAFVLAGAFGASAMQAPAARPAASAAKATAAKATAPAAVQKVPDRALVCMVNDMDMGKAQIPVVVEGRTYYGCCAMCKERLAKDAAIRSAIDPVSGKSVDKAKAVIGKRPDGSVVYFETEANLRRYAAKR